MKVYHVTYTVTIKGQIARYTEDWMGYNRRDVRRQIKDGWEEEIGNSSVKILRIHRRFCAA